MSGERADLKDFGEGSPLWNAMLPLCGNLAMGVSEEERNAVEPRLDQGTVGYVDHASDPKTTCGGCKHYHQIGGHCEKVSGLVYPTGWCPLWAVRPESVASVVDRAKATIAQSKTPNGE